MKNSQKAKAILFTPSFQMPEAVKALLAEYAVTHVNVSFMDRNDDGELIEIPALKVMGAIPEGLYKTTPRHTLHEAVCEAMGIAGGGVTQDDPSKAHTDAPQAVLGDDEPHTDDEQTDGEPDFDAMTSEDLDAFCAEHGFEIKAASRRNLTKYRAEVVKAYESL